MIESEVMLRGNLFTFCECVKLHVLEIARSKLGGHASGMAKPYASIGKRLALLRETMGISQAELCRQIKCTTNRWNQYESGDRRITLPVAIKVCDEYGATLDWIYRNDRSGLPPRLHAVAAKAA